MASHLGKGPADRERKTDKSLRVSLYSYPYCQAPNDAPLGRVSPWCSHVSRALENESHAVLEGIRHMLNSPVQVLPDHSLHQERFEVTAR